LDDGKKNYSRNTPLNSFLEFSSEWLRHLCFSDNMDDDGKNEEKRQQEVTWVNFWYWISLLELLNVCQLIKDILDKAYRHCVTDAILLQRMTGRTIFSLSNGYVGIRLETFYSSRCLVLTCWYWTMAESMKQVNFASPFISWSIKRRKMLSFE
jgi:hypothetical protein